MRKYLALLALPLVACHTPTLRPYTVHIDTWTVPDLHYKIAVDALLDWHEVEPEFDFVVDRQDLATYDSEERNAIWITEMPVVNEKDNRWAECAREPSTESSIIRVRPEGFWSTVLKHEIGHALRLDHADCGVMRPTVPAGEWRPIAKCDANQFAATWFGFR